MTSQKCASCQCAVDAGAAGERSYVAPSIYMVMTRELSTTSGKVTMMMPLVGHFRHFWYNALCKVRYIRKIQWIISL
jgi:hypothetical protein